MTRRKPTRSEKSRPAFSARLLTFLVALGLAQWLFPAGGEAAQVTIGWSPSAGARVAGYKIHWGGSARQYDRHANVGSRTTFTLKGLKESRVYHIAATAYDGQGRESRFSEELIYSVPKATGADQIAQDTDGDGFLDAWETGQGFDPLDAGSPPVVGALLSPWVLFPTAGLTLAGPEAAASRTGVNLVIRGADDGVYQMEGSLFGGWGAWNALGGLTPSKPAAVEVSGELHVFVRGTDDGIYTSRRAGKTWTPWVEVPGGGLAASGPEALWFRDELHLFVRGIGDGIYLNRYDGSNWSGWEPLAGSTPSAPSAIVLDGEMHLFVRGIDDGIYLNRYNGSNWSGWSALGGMTIAGPEAAVFRGAPYLFVPGVSGTPYAGRIISPSRAEWISLPGATPSALGSALAEGVLYLVVRGLDDAIYVSYAFE